MQFKTHSTIIEYYRLFFIVLFLLLGISGTGITVLDYYTGVDIIPINTIADKQALFATSSVMGGIGFFTAFIMIYLMREKRKTTFDRRMINKPLDFIDRRSNKDRRSN
jgi:hypothetical protein